MRLSVPGELVELGLHVVEVEREPVLGPAVEGDWPGDRPVLGHQGLLQVQCCADVCVINSFHLCFLYYSSFSLWLTY